MSKFIYIISEYDPFHTGHEYMINRIRELYGECTVIAVMSENFTQRGGAACADKYTRAHSAVMGGVDLVFSLPFPFCASSAEYFAGAGVRIVEGLASAFKNDEHILVFGSESGDTDAIYKTALRLSDADFASGSNNDVGSHTARGVERLYREIYNDDTADLLRSPNDTLAVEYVKHIISSGFDIGFRAVKREGSRHGDMSGEGFPSSSYLRSLLGGSKISSALSHIPERARPVYAEFFNKYGSGNITNAEDAVIYALRTANDFSDIAECRGGVGERLSSAAKASSSYDEMMRLASTKQYTNAHFRRAALFSTCGIRGETISSQPLYTQLLAAGARGIQYLHTLVRSDFPILTKSADYEKLPPEAARQYEISERSRLIYTMCFSPHLPADAFSRITPYIEK